MNNYIKDLNTWQQHESRSQELHKACGATCDTTSEEYQQMRLAQLHHLAQSCVNMKEKWV